MEPVLEEEELAPQAALDDNCLHPLESSWDLWYLSNDKQKEWDDRLTKLMTFNTVEDFWALYHHLQLPSKLPIGSDYMLFKTGIQPKWEDPKNENGGKWTIETTRGFRSQLDAAWLETLLSIIGEGMFFLFFLVLCRVYVFGDHLTKAKLVSLIIISLGTKLKPALITLQFLYFDISVRLYYPLLFSFGLCCSQVNL